MWRRTATTSDLLLDDAVPMEEHEKAGEDDGQDVNRARETDRGLGGSIWAEAVETLCAFRRNAHLAWMRGR